MSSILNNIAKLKTNNRKRVGRGIGSGTGKTCGRGVKGQKARTGCNMKGFEGGQTPLYMRLPKKGFKSRFKDRYEVVNLKNIVSLVNSKKIDTGAIVDKETLFNLGLISSKDVKVKLITHISTSISENLSVQVDFYSKQAHSLARK